MRLSSLAPALLLATHCAAKPALSSPESAGVEHSYADTPSQASQRCPGAGPAMPSIREGSVDLLGGSEASFLVCGYGEIEKNIEGEQELRLQIDAFYDGILEAALKDAVDQGNGLVQLKEEPYPQWSVSLGCAQNGEVRVQTPDGKAANWGPVSNFGSVEAPQLVVLEFVKHPGYSGECLSLVDGVELNPGADLASGTKR